MDSTAAPETRRRPTGEEREAEWSERWLEWAIADLARLDAQSRPAQAPIAPRRVAAAEQVQKAPQAVAQVEQPRRLSYQERMARLEALVGPMRAMPVPRSLLEPTAPGSYQAHLMRIWGGR